MNIRRKQKRARPSRGGKKRAALDRRTGTDRRGGRGGAMQERTAKKLTRRMHQQAVASHLSNIALANPNFGQFMNEVVSHLARSLDAEFAKILELDQNGRRLVLRAGIGWDQHMKNNKTTFASTSTIAGRTIMSKKPLIIRDLRDTDFKGLSHLKRHKVISGMSVIIPSIRRPRPYGALGVFSKHKKAFTEDELNFLQSVANVIALAYERNRAESELRRFQYMADNANVGISLIDKDGRFRYANKKTYERLGLSRDEYMKRRVRHKLDAKSPPKFKELFSMVQKRQLPPIETYELKKDGKSIVPLEINLTGVTFEGESYMFAVSQDISARKRESERVSFLVEASLLLASSLDYAEALNSMAKIAAGSIADWFSVEMYGEKGEVEIVAVGHKDMKKAEWAKRLRRNHLTGSRRRRKEPSILRSGKPELYPVITDEAIREAAESPQHLKLLRLMNPRSVMSVPIRVSRKVIGALHFVISDSDKQYDRTDLAIASELANRAALAIENSRLYLEIEANRERLDKIITNVPGIVWERWIKEAPEENRLNFVSDYVQEMLGYSADDWKRPDFWRDVIHPEDRDRAKEEYRALLKNGKRIVQRLRWMRKDGSPLWTESHVSVVSDHSGKAIGMRGVTMDASESIELEKRKDEFISMASHELKTPVTTLKVFTQILERQAQKSEIQDFASYLSKMDLQISRLTDLINDLLDLSKIQTGKLSFKLTPFLLEELVAEVVEQIQPTVEHSITVSGSVGKTITGDRDRLGQVIINLLTNAIKYSPKADRVHIALSAGKRHVRIAVEDFGIGISPEDQKKIFTRFYQVTEGDQKTFPGLGIGLYISDEIVRRHGGTISVDSKPGKGSTFTITLPTGGPEKQSGSTDNQKIVFHE